MPAIRKILGSLVLGATLSACATGPKLAPAGEFVAGDYAVTLGSDWNAIQIKTGKKKKANLLTKDGPALNAVYLFSDIQPGDSLLRQRRKDNPVPIYSEDLFDLELVEFLTDSLAKGGGMVGLTPQNVRPDSFLGDDAIRFELSGQTSQGLLMSGSALMSSNNGGLDIVLFLAPSEYYAGKVGPDVDLMFRSVSGAAAVGGSGSGSGVSG